MKGFALALCVCLAAVVAPLATGEPAGWAVTGSGIVAGDHVEIAAHSDVGGANATGHGETTQSLLNGVVATPNYGGNVICLSVIGNKALAVYKLRQPITFASIPGAVFRYASVYIEDNGEPVDGQPVDRMADFINTGTGFCTIDAATPFLATLAAPVESGNYVVRDGS